MDNLYFSLYTSLTAITIFTMIVTAIFIKFNETLNKNEKRLWSQIIFVIIIGSLTEYASTFYDTYKLTTPFLIVLQKSTKFLELSFSPYLNLLLLKLISKNEKMISNLKLVIFVNLILEIQSAFTGNIYCIDSDGQFNRGNLFFIFIMIYSFGFVCIITELISQSRTRQTKNYYCYLAVFGLLLIGIGIQLVVFELKVDWLAIAISAILLLFQYCDTLLKKDGLTGLLTRKMFDNMCKELTYDSAFAVMDLNDFRVVNNTYGHQEGDKCLQIIAEKILKVYAQYGYCYRYGGDEMLVILKKNAIKHLLEKHETQNLMECLEKLDQELEENLMEERKKLEYLPKISTGFCKFNYETDTLMDVMKLADENMYNRKKEMKTNK